MTHCSLVSRVMSFMFTNVQQDPDQLTVSLTVFDTFKDTVTILSMAWVRFDLIARYVERMLTAESDV